MSKYVVPSITISALFGAYHQYSRPNAIRSPAEAIDALNGNTRVDEAVRFLEKNPVDSSLIAALSPSSLGRLCERGSPVCQLASLHPFDDVDDEVDFEALLRKFDLGDEWAAGLDWLNRTVCNNDEDLACGDDFLGRRPSTMERLLRLLQLLFIKTEERVNPDMIPSNVVAALHALYQHFDESNKEISVLALKTLANIVNHHAAYATELFKSEWVPILSHMIVNGRTLDHRLIAHKICRNALHSLGVVDYRLLSDVYEVHLPQDEPLFDIVLIHGLRGSVGYTWRQRDGGVEVRSECWPKDWLPEDLSEPFRIVAIDYPSYLVQFTGTMESLQVRADRFRQQLAAAGIGRRPVVFVCHSMGGLLAKRMLLDEPQFKNKTVGILFIATPHRGSPLAAWGYSILHPSADVLLLHEENQLNKQLNTDFSRIADSIPIIVSMIETRESDLIGTSKGIVVPKESAVFGRGALYHIDEVHHNVCKPSERSSPSYGVILNFLRDSMREAKKLW